MYEALADGKAFALVMEMVVQWLGGAGKEEKRIRTSKVSFYDFLTIFRRIKNIPFQKASVSLFTCMKP